MKLTKIVISILLVVSLAVPAMASSNWLEDFLRRYDPSKSVKPSQNNTAANIGQFIRTGEVPVTVNDVVNMMIDNSLDIRSDRLAPRSSYFQALVFYRALLPSFRLTSNIARNNSLSTSQLNGATSQIRDTYLFDANVSQQLASGLSFTVDLNMTRLLTNSNNSIFNPSYTGSAIYTVGQHLLQNRGRVVNMHQILQGQISEKMSEITFELQLISLLSQAQKSYWDLVFAAQNLDVLQRSVEVAQKTLEDNKTMVEIGTLARVDLLQTEADVATRQDLVVQAQYAVTTAEDQIKKVISSDKDPSMFLVKLRAQDSPIRPEAVQIPSLEEGVRIALENRPEMRQAALALKNNDIDLQYTANQRLPVFDVTGSYTQNGTGGTQNRGFILNTPLATSTPGYVAACNCVPGGVFDSLSQMFGYGHTGFSAGFSLVIPLNNKAADADHTRALNDLRVSQSKLDLTMQQIALDVRTALMAVEMNRARIVTAHTASDLARQTTDAEQEKFNLGTSTLQFVLQDQRNATLAESNEVQTVVNFTKSLVDLDVAMGMTLRKNNVQIDKTLGPVSLNVRRSSTASAN
jgi:outer membrane protein